MHDKTSGRSLSARLFPYFLLVSDYSLSRKLLQGQPHTLLHIIRRILRDGLDGCLCLNNLVAQRGQRRQDLGIGI